ncbi:MAG: hypothetical protein ACO3PV_09375 [Pseudohongiellaceae bacterium]
MSTNIQIDVVLQRLQEQARQVLGQNRSERQEREEALQQQQTGRSANQQSDAVGVGAPQQFPLVQQRADSAREHSGVPDLYKKRRIAAQRDGQTLVPFAFSWRGDTTIRTPYVYEFQTRGVVVTSPVPPSIITYTGGDYLVPHSFQVASSGTLAEVAQTARHSEWRTKAKIAWLDFYGPEWTYEGFWAEELRSTIYADALTWELPSSPGNLSPVGPMSHTSAPQYLGVGTDGTMFMVLELPYDVAEIQSVQAPSTTPLATFYRDVYYSSSNEPFKLSGLQQYTNVGGVNYYNGLPLGTTLPYASTPLYTFAGKPYMFLRVKGGNIAYKTAKLAVGANFSDFYLANAYEDDPGKNLRSTYAGEVRLRGNTAHILRMRYEELFEGETYVWYENFPFSSLTRFITGTGAQAKLQAGVTFEDHVYTLASYSTDAELASQLAAISTPFGTQINPPYRAVPVKVADSFVAAAAKRISNAGSDELTPLTFFAAMP